MQSVIAGVKRAFWTGPYQSTERKRKKYLEAPAIKEELLLFAKQSVRKRKHHSEIVLCQVLSCDGTDIYKAYPEAEQIINC